jgi:hypothetical protein
LIAALKDVPAKGVSNNSDSAPTKMNGRLMMSLTISGKSKPMSKPL